MNALVAVPRHARLGQGFSKRAQLKAIEHPGRRTAPHGYQSAVAWVSDLIALRKAVILCVTCCRKFEAHAMRRVAYRKVYVADFTGKTDGYTVNGSCDVCTQETMLVGGGRAYQAEEVYAQTHMDPSEARRIARAAAKQLGTWDFLQREQRSAR